MRKDLEIITELVPKYSKILDIGCDEGELLAHLKESKKTIGIGLEIENSKVSKALAKGISVIQGDADNDLESYPDDSMDYAILSQTLQATKYPKYVVTEMLRIAKYAIISVPNFGYIENRLQLLVKGRMPVTKNLPYEWYSTPNIHFCTVKDFELMIEELGFKVEKRFFLHKSLPFVSKIGCSKIANILAQDAVYLISKPVKVKVLKKNGIKNGIARKRKNAALARSGN